MEAYLRAGGATVQYCIELKTIKMAQFDWERQWGTPRSQSPYGYVSGDYAAWARAIDKKGAARRQRRKLESAENYATALQKVAHHVVNGVGGCLNESNHGSCYMCWKEK